MSRQDAINCAATYFDSGDFLKDLERRIAIKTESQIFDCLLYTSDAADE